MGIFTLVAADESSLDATLAPRPEETVKSLVSAALLRAGARFTWLDPWTIDLILNGRLVQADLTDVVRSWRLAAETHRDNVVERWVQATLAYPAWEARREEITRTFASARDRVLIRLQPAGHAADGQPLVRAYAPGMDAAVFVDVDRPRNGLTYAASGLSAADLGRWSAEQVDDVEVLAQARANTRRVIEPWHVGVQELPGGSRVSLVVSEASRGASPALFLEDLLPAAAPYGVLLSVPQHDTTMIHLITDRQRVGEAVPWMVARAAQMFALVPYPVSPEVYWWRDDTLSLLAVDRGGRDWQINPDEEFTDMYADLPDTPADPAG